MTVATPAAPSDLSEFGTSAAPTPQVCAVDGGSAGSLVLAAREGNRLAWEELVGRFSPLLWAVARRQGLSRDDSAEVVQTTWLRCVERLDQVQDPSRVAAWLVTICRRESLAVLRREARTGSKSVGDPAELIASMPDPLIREPADALIDQGERVLLRDAISQLPDRPRQVLLALLENHEGGGGYREIARQLDLPVGSIGPTRQRALHTLRGDPRLQTLRDAGRS